MEITTKRFPPIAISPIRSKILVSIVIVAKLRFMKSSHILDIVVVFVVFIYNRIHNFQKEEKEERKVEKKERE